MTLSVPQWKALSERTFGERTIVKCAKVISTLASGILKSTIQVVLFIFSSFIDIYYWGSITIISIELHLIHPSCVTVIDWNVWITRIVGWIGNGHTPFRNNENMGTPPPIEPTIHVVSSLNYMCHLNRCGTALALFFIAILPTVEYSGVSRVGLLEHHPR